MKKVLSVIAILIISTLCFAGCNFVKDKEASTATSNEYFDFAEGFNEMLDKGLIEKINFEGQECYIPTEKGRCVARELKGDILSSILDQSLARALRYIDFKRSGIECRCKIEEIEGGRCEVHCTFHQNKKEVFSLKYVVDTYDRARRMKENFDERPETIYRGIMGLMAGNVNYLFD